MIKFVTLALGLVGASAFANTGIDDLSKLPGTEQRKSSGFHGQVGLGAAYLPEYVGGDDNETIAIPLINVNYNDRIYFKFNRLGAWLYKMDNGFRLGALVTSHHGIDEKDLPDQFDGYGDRDASTMAGINVAYSQGKLWSDFAVLKDISDNSDGTKLQAQIGYTFLANKQYSVSANAKVEALDEDMVNYYYNNKESTTNFSLSLIGTYKLSPKWTLLGVLSTTSLGDEISDSQIVEDDTPMMAIVGATYSF